MITINKAILHLLNFNSGVAVISEQELDLHNKSAILYLTKHVEKSIGDLNLKSGVLQENGKFKKLMMDYVNNDLDFVNFSKYVADIIYASISNSDKLDSLDLIVCDFNAGEDRLIGILECKNRIGFTHQVVKDNGKIKNDIINHYAILPGISQKLDAFAFVDVNSLSAKFIDKKRYIDGKDVFVIPDIVLECNSCISPREAVNLVNSVTRMVAENHGQSSVLAISKAKNFILENAEVSEYIEPIELGKEVFNSSEVMQEEFVREIRNAGVPDILKMDRTFAIKTGKNHKIKTDTGIELSFPVYYFQNKDYIEFINNPDGTLSIELKNIGKIINK